MNPRLLCLACFNGAFSTPQIAYSEASLPVPAMRPLMSDSKNAEMPGIHEPAMVTATSEPGFIYGRYLTGTGIICPLVAPTDQ